MRTSVIWRSAARLTTARRQGRDGRVCIWDLERFGGANDAVLELPCSTIGFCRIALLQRSRAAADADGDSGTLLAVPSDERGSVHAVAAW